MHGPHHHFQALSRCRGPWAAAVLLRPLWTSLWPFLAKSGSEISNMILVEVWGVQLSHGHVRGHQWDELRDSYPYGHGAGRGAAGVLRGVCGDSHSAPPPLGAVVYCCRVSVDIP